MEDDIFTRLEKSAFRARFKLSAKDRAYAEQKGPAELRRHAEDFIAKRLAPAVIPNDGRQTPMRNHPVLPRSMPPQPAADSVFTSGTA